MLLQLLLLQLPLQADGCQSDRNQDHRPRVSCVHQGLTAPPPSVQSDTQVLVLSRNSFTSLSWSMYSRFPELHELDLSHNHISTLEPPGPVLENLKVLRLSGNRLTGLGGLMFRGAPGLMEIYLDSNQIRSLHDATFSELPSLEVINLSGNKLPALPPRLLERISSGGLKTFDLENNSVSLMPNNFFSSKPELPYVYLTHNPWLCSCAVDYLHAYLNDQEHNVYKHDGPNDIIPAADTVVCSGPPHLLNRPIMELEESNFCPADPTSPPGTPLVFPPSGDWDRNQFPHVLYVQRMSTPQMQNTPQDTSTSAEWPNPPSAQSPGGSWLTESWTGPWKISEFILDPTTGPGTLANPSSDTPTGDNTRQQTFTSYTFPTKTDSLTTPGYQAPSPTPADSSLTTNPTQFVPTTTPASRSPSPALTDNRRMTIPAELPTHRSQHQSTIRPEPHTSTPEFVTEQPTGAALSWSDTLGAGGQMLPWCWWLFAGFVLLCVLSALASCVLCLWLLRLYLLVYRQLRRPTAGGTGVILRAFRRTAHMQGREHEGESVSFLALDRIRDVQAVFRSVLFIEQRDEPEGISPTAEEEPPVKVELVSVADQRDKDSAAAAASEDVFRKTLYREISRGEEAGGWREEERRSYSLILRQDGGPQWLIGAWQMGAGGVACGTSCSLIGQPSTVEGSTAGDGHIQD